MWICRKPVLTSCGWVQPGRVVDEGDPMLEGTGDAWERLIVEGSPVELPVVEEATAEPGRVRRTVRKGAQ